MSIIDHAKELAELIKKYNDQDLYQRIMTLREEIFALREENLDLKEQLKTLKENEISQSELIRKGNYYVTKDDPEGQKNIYCMACWDHDRKLISLIRAQGGAYGGMIICPICQARKKKS